MLEIFENISSVRFFLRHSVVRNFTRRTGGELGHGSLPPECRGTDPVEIGAKSEEAGDTIENQRNLLRDKDHHKFRTVQIQSKYRPTVQKKNSMTALMNVPQCWPLAMPLCPHNARGGVWPLQYGIQKLNGVHGSKNLFSKPTLKFDQI